MSDSVPSVSLVLDHISDGLKLTIDERIPNSLYEMADAALNLEAPTQLVEGCFYDFEFSDDRFFFMGDTEKVVIAHKRRPHIGTFAPNIYVGTLKLLIGKKEQGEVGELLLEVQSAKTGYRQDYRDMLEYITERCTDLLLQANAPVSHHFEVDYTKDNETIYQRFAFISSIIASDEFNESVHRIVTTPVTRWSETTEPRDVRQVRRFTNSNLKELAGGHNRNELPARHHLRKSGIVSLPARVTTSRKTDSVDTPENRFVKHALEVFLKFCTDVQAKANSRSRLFNEAAQVIRELESHLHHSVFRDISRPQTLKLNSPVLQRKEGYREVLRVWLMYDLAAKLIWKGGEDVYKGGKKDIATLYEYWLFFVLIELFQSIFHIPPKEVKDLIKPTTNGLDLQLKQGKETVLSGVYNSGTRNFNVRFSYNRVFSGKKNYPDSGSWTSTMRPDYTLSIWPEDLAEDQAEAEELIVHIHFDAKYKVDSLADLLEKDSEIHLDEEKTENRKGKYRNADLLKMHAYKDAIRRTGGAYVLYPGENSGPPKRGFHEIIPGLGAFSVRPSKNENGIVELRSFVLEVLKHFTNRTSQRERMSLKTYQVHKEKPGKRLEDRLPEPYGPNRSMIPDETFVLVAFYKSPEHLDWILKTKLYNTRTENKRGSLRLGPGESGAAFVLLHSENEATEASILLKVKETGPRVFSKQALVNKDYPTEPTQDYYLVYRVEQVLESEFSGNVWDLTKLDRFKTGRGSALPFAVTLNELMQKALVRTD